MVASSFLAIVLCSSCALDDAKEFKKASKDFMGCTMEAPWHVELKSIDERSAFFIRANNESPPFGFVEREIPIWESTTIIVPESIKIKSYPPYRVALFVMANPDDGIDFEYPYAVIRRDKAEILLPAELSAYWEDLLNSCLENMQTEEL